MPKIDYSKLSTKDTRPITKAARVTQDQSDWFDSVTEKHNTNVSTIILHALEKTYNDFPKS